MKGGGVKPAAHRRRYLPLEDELIREAFIPRRERIARAAAELGRTPMAITRRNERLRREARTKEG